MTDPESQRYAADDPIDALLAQARWSEPWPESQARLAEAWSSCSPVREGNSRSRVPEILGGIAAVLLIGFVAAFVFLDHRRQPIVNVAQNGPPVRSVFVSHTDSDLKPVVRRAFSRPATGYERWALLYAPRPRREANPAKAGPEIPAVVYSRVPPDGLPGVDARARSMVLRLTLVPDSAARRRMLAGWLKEGSPVALQATLLALTQPNLREDARAAATAHPPDAVQLLSHFNDAHVEYRFAAAALLGANCAPDRCRMLEQMVRQNNHRREALAALLCCSDTEAGKFIAGLRSNRSLDAQLRYAHDRVARLCS